MFSHRETDSGFTPGSTEIDRAGLDAVIDRVLVGDKAAGQAVVVVPRFDDLPAAVLAKAKVDGYDNTSANERITGVTYKGEIDLVQENIPSALVAWGNIVA
jgi:hypothetical protein